GIQVYCGCDQDVTPGDRKVAVIGLGYVGLPLAALCAKKGYPVTGLDTNPGIVASLAGGKCHIRDAAAERLLNEALASNNFSVTTDSGEIADCSIYLVCVPTPVDANNEPDLGPLESACRLLAPLLQEDDLVVVESTVFPGTCEQVVAPLLEQISELEAGSDFHLAHCPERINPGDPFWTSENIPRVVGATSEAGLDLAARFYASILGGAILNVREIKQSLYPKFRETAEGLHISQVPLGSVTKMNSIRDAEAVKAMENTVRDVNIAFVNELARISDALDLDVVDIIDGMATKPFGKGPFYPGVGVGGHCIAVDPEWLKAASKKAGYMPEMIQLARMTNNGMPEYSISLLQDLLNQRGYPVNGTTVAILGVAYKRNVDDVRGSPFFRFKNLLQTKGALINVYDSWIRSENTAGSLQDAVNNAKAVVIITEHTDMIDELRHLNLADTEVEIVLDGRNCLDADWVRNQGLLYRGIGRRSLVQARPVIDEN
ncbi:MAG: nucleotide sugar dehydrogenase, partial [Gammaproteobacteria bacterium]|nr:nucleotide sugar dehydrogenase [Gammaproteobacteria bacterium]